ncbi:MAG TPA: TRAP transporter TatT component family protein [Vicinamibacteria bacterium]|nr:TRAP transporter TatT component family protein [Vicinamibacteria bacterium]
MRTHRLTPTALVLALALPGCSIRSIAVNSLGNALAEGGSSYGSDDDPDLVGDAIPFGLKTMEGLLREAPRHRGLLFAASSGFTQYAYGWVQLEADLVEAHDLAMATAMRDRARRLYLRALDYGFRGLEVDLPGLRERLRRDPETALARAKKKQVPLLYWTAAAWGAAIALSISDSELSADQSRAATLARRALELDETYDAGAIHDFFAAYEAGRASVGGSIEKAREHFERSVQISGGRRAFPFVSFAESASVSRQDKEEFRTLLERALAVDVSRPSDHRLANLLAQKRARWLLSRTDELFIE